LASGQRCHLNSAHEPEDDKHGQQDQARPLFAKCSLDELVPVLQRHQAVGSLFASTVLCIK